MPGWNENQEMNPTRLPQVTTNVAQYPLYEKSPANTPPLPHPFSPQVTQLCIQFPMDTLMGGQQKQSTPVLVYTEKPPGYI